MYDHDYFKDGYRVNSPEERERNNLEQSLEVEKPDMTNIPHRDKFTWKTPLDYSGSLKYMLDKYSTYYWHPELTADEYMRYQEYVFLKYVENVCTFVCFIVPPSFVTIPSSSAIASVPTVVPPSIRLSSAAVDVTFVPPKEKPSSKSVTLAPEPAPSAKIRPFDPSGIDTLPPEPCVKVAV